MSLRYPLSEQDHVQGNPNATIELIEYGDYQCPYCWKAYPIVKELQEQLGDKLKFAFRNFPLTKIHPYAMLAATASEAAALQGKYWEMHDLLFENHKKLGKNALLEYAAQLELDTDRFEQDLLSDTLTEKVEADFFGGIRSGVNATPTFFINGEKYTDEWDGNNLVDYMMMSGLIHRRF
jgi:protein-disulfide isomerase